MTRETRRIWQQTGKTLVGALPYMQQYDNAVIVVKIGGYALTDTDALTSFGRDVVLMRQVGINLVILHGGAPKINSMLSRLGIETRFIRGKRVSDPQVVEIVEMVLAGHVNKLIVHAINHEGGRAVGISGKDAGLLNCQLADPELGQVGIPSRIDVRVINSLCSNGFIPVIAPLGLGPNCETLNVNGDTAAGCIASALSAERLMLLTDVDGVLDEAGQLVTRLTTDLVQEMIGQGQISGGMIPKTETAIEAISQGVRAAVILNGRTPHSMLLELFTEHGVGTMISDDPGPQ